MPRPRAQWRSLQDWPVSARLVAVIALALGISLIFGGLRVADGVGSAEQFGRVTQLAQLGEQGVVLVQDLQNERDESAAVIAGAAPAALKPLYSATDTAAAGFTADARALGGGFPANIQSGVTTALTDAENIPQVRKLATGNGNPTTVITDYADSIQDVISVAGLIAQGVSDSVLSSDVRTLDSLSQVKEEASQQRALLFNALTQGFFSIGVETAVNTAAAQQQLDQAAVQTTATAAQQAALASTFSSSQANSAANIEDFMISDSDPFTDIVNLGISRAQAPGTWYSLMSAEINQLQGSALGIAQSIVARAQSLQSSAQQSVIITAVVTLVVILLVLLATFIVARSLVLPLRRLRAGALDIATTQLPDRVRRMSGAGDTETDLEVAPIDVVSADEIGQVARAFDQVHAEAVRLAGEQALLRSSFNAVFVNLSRRLQSLIERLARMIDSLEQTEEDPDRLSGLFSMDHLVTRMRRNAENLLLLAGHESPRKWSEPVPLADVARAATSEIEQYNRVVLNIPPGVSIVGQAVSDVAHLLAELIENATTFSSKDTRVSVSTQELSSGGVLIEIVDKGIGVSDARLTDINWRLDNPPTIDASVSRHMGLFAVARLAERHRVRVRLRPAPSKGVSALVWLPDSIIERGRLGVGTSWSAQPVGARAGAGKAAALTSGTGGAVSLASGYAGGNDPVEAPAASGWFRGGPDSASGSPAATGGQPGAFAPDPGEPLTSGQTVAGLPVRVPRANPPQEAAMPPGPDTSAPGIHGLPSRTPGGGRPAGTGNATANGGNVLPPRSPERARSRLAGFQRGSRRAEGQTGSVSQVPRAGEGTGR